MKNQVKIYLKIRTRNYSIQTAPVAKTTGHTAAGPLKNCCSRQQTNQNAAEINKVESRLLTEPAALRSQE